MYKASFKARWLYQQNASILRGIIQIWTLYLSNTKPMLAMDITVINIRNYFVIIGFDKLNYEYFSLLYPTRL